MCDDSPVDIVDLGTRDQPILSTAAPRFLTRWSIGSDQAAAILVTIGFGLVLASQWFSWFSVRVQPDLFGPDDGLAERLAPSFGITDSASVVQMPYYLVWLVLFTCCSASLFAPRSRRGLWLGAAAGALVTQVLIVTPIIHRPTVLLNNVFQGLDFEARVERTAGTYCVIAAMVVIAAGLVMALRTYMRPAAAHHGRSDSTDAVPARPIMPDAFPAASPVGGHAPDIQLSLPPQVVPLDGGARPEAIDHSMYARPVEMSPGE
jgi:hypothetical protein